MKIDGVVIAPADQWDSASDINTVSFNATHQGAARKLILHFNKEALRVQSWNSGNSGNSGQ